MKIKVTKRYIDRYTKEDINAGRELTVSEERGRELIEQKVAEEVNEKTGKKAAEKVVETTGKEG